MSHDDQLIRSWSAKPNKLRNHCFTQFCTFEQGHAGGTMSVIDIVTACTSTTSSSTPRTADWPERDRVVLSKAHCCEAIYAALVELGVYPEETLGTYYCYGSPFQGHADRWSHGGHRLLRRLAGPGAVVRGRAGLRREAEDQLRAPRSGPRRFLPRYILRLRPRLPLATASSATASCQEGKVWEAAMFAAQVQAGQPDRHRRLQQVVARRPHQRDHAVEPLVDKWKAFGWWVTGDRRPRHAPDRRCARH